MVTTKQYSLYVLWVPSLEVFKIGYTNNLERRLQELRRGLPEFEFIGSHSERKDGNKGWNEKRVHNLFSHYNLISDGINTSEFFYPGPEVLDWVKVLFPHWRLKVLLLMLKVDREKLKAREPNEEIVNPPYDSPLSFNYLRYHGLWK